MHVLLSYRQLYCTEKSDLYKFVKSMVFLQQLQGEVVTNNYSIINGNYNNFYYGKTVEWEY